MVGWLEITSCVGLVCSLLYCGACCAGNGYVHGYAVIASCDFDAG